MSRTTTNQITKDRTKEKLRLYFSTKALKIQWTISILSLKRNAQHFYYLTFPTSVEGIKIKIIFYSVFFCYYCCCWCVDVIYLYLYWWNMSQEGVYYRTTQTDVVIYPNPLTPSPTPPSSTYSVQMMVQIPPTWLFTPGINLFFTHYLS